MKAPALVALLALGACVSADDYLAQCGYNRQCAQNLANQENGRRTGEGINALITGLAAGAVIAGSVPPPQPIYVAPPPRPIYIAPPPRTCTTYRYGNVSQTQCY